MRLCTSQTGEDSAKIGFLWAQLKILQRDEACLAASKGPGSEAEV